jgi:putative membrane protein
MTKRNVSILILVIFHVIGITLFVLDESYASLSYVNLLVTAVVLLINENDFTSVVKLALIGAGGFIIELIGTKTGLLFGNYSYGSALGFKLFEVPVIIALNWMIIVRAGHSIGKLFTKNRIVIALIAAITCTALDVLIEPVAIQYDFWNWHKHEIPVFNYLCWFIFSFIFALLFDPRRKENDIGLPIVAIWTIFFTILNII